MKIELKHIHVQEWNSDETICYFASLYVDGRKIGRVSNAGDGSADRFDGDHAAYAEADRWVAENMPPWDVNGQEIPASIEDVCLSQVVAHQDAMFLKSKMESSILVHRPNKGGVHAYAVPRRTPLGEPVFDAVRSLIGEDNITILNTVPLTEAVALYRGATS